MSWQSAFKAVNKENTAVNWPTPPCQAACPVSTDARRYVNLIAQERYEEALEVIMENNPLPSVIGRICAHPCEQACRRGQIEEPIAICHLKRFVTEKTGYISDHPKLQPVAKKRKERIAIIGSGPSGLTAAYDLAKLGYRVTIYERQEKPGGMLRYGILNYRLPEAVLDSDIKNILALGIDLETSVNIGEDLSFKQLLNDYNAVLVAVGLSESRLLPLEGVNLRGVIGAVPFLYAVNSGKPLPIGKNVVVIGGGNVAIDVARTAKRLGSEQVKLVCLEARDEMPAHEWEIEDALEEGIEINCSWGPDRLIGEKGQVTGLEFKKCTCVFDEQGRFNPQFDVAEKTVIPCDTVILAIGQAGNINFLKSSGLSFNERGQVVYDKTTLQTSLPQVFVSGEIATGPGAAIQAIASGHQAAKSINAYLSGLPLEKWRLELEPVAALPQHTVSKIWKTSRRQMPKLEVEKRISNFLEVEKGYDEENAIKEAQRCLMCTAGAEVNKDKCVACLTCVRICPYDVPEIVGDKAYMDPIKCQSCGLCAAECPNQAIKVTATVEQLYELQLANSLAIVANRRVKPVVAAVVCQFGHIWGADKTYEVEKSLPKNVALVRVLCPGRLTPVDFLRAFEYGADRLLVTVCGEKYCHYSSGNNFTEQHLSIVSQTLAAAGIGADKLVTAKIYGQTKLAEEIAKVLY